MSKFLRYWQWAEAAIAVIAFTLVALALIVDVSGRELYALATTLGLKEFARDWLGGTFGAQRFAVHATQVAGMLGFCIVVAVGGHLRPTVVDRLFPERHDRLVNRISDLLSAAICLGLAWICWEFVESTRRNAEISMVFQVQIWPFQLILPYVFLSGGLRYVIFALLPAHRPETTGMAA